MTQALEVVTVEGVRGYLDEHGTAWLNVEDVATGLGFTQTQEKFSPTCGGKLYTSIRWERVNGYLAEFGYPPVKKGDFIPESMFYRLAMKASNKAAQDFQSKVADEILPSIRKHGAYLTLEAAEKILFNPDFIIKLAQQVKDLKAECDALRPDADYCRNVLQSPDTMPVTVIAKEYGMSGTKLNQLLVDAKLIRKVGGTYVLNQPYAGMGYAETETLWTAGGVRKQLKWTEKGRHLIHKVLQDKCPTNRERHYATPELF